MFDSLTSRDKLIQHHQGTQWTILFVLFCVVGETTIGWGHKQWHLIRRLIDGRAMFCLIAELQSMMSVNLRGAERGSERKEREI